MVMLSAFSHFLWLWGGFSKTLSPLCSNNNNKSNQPYNLLMYAMSLAVSTHYPKISQVWKSVYKWGIRASAALSHLSKVTELVNATLAVSPSICDSETWPNLSRSACHQNYHRCGVGALLSDHSSPYSHQLLVHEKTLLWLSKQMKS